MTYDPYAISEPDEASNQKLDALRYLQMVYRDPQLSTAVRMRAAGLAINYESPRLAVTAVVQDNDLATLLDQRIKRYEQMKLIEAKPTNNDKIVEGNPVDARLPPSIPDRRYRRF